MPAVLMLFGAGLFAPNPLSIAFRGGAFDPARPGAVALSRHPILAAFALWALVHLPANGDLTSVILFGGAAVFALVGMLILDRRRRELGAEWHRLAASTMALPGAAILLGRARVPTDGRTLAGAALGLFLYALLLAGLHRVLFGADPLAAL